MQVWKGHVWNDGLQGYVDMIEECGGVITVEARSLIGAIDRGEISRQVAIDLYIDHINKGNDNYIK